MTDSTSEHWIAALDEVGLGLQQSTQRLREALLSVVKLAAAAVGAAESSIVVPTADSGCLGFLVSYSPHAKALADVVVHVETSIVGRVYTTGQMIAIEDEPPVVPIPGAAPKIYLAYPLMLDDATLGVATYVNRPGEPPFERFTKKEMQIASQFAILESILVRQYLRAKALASLSASELSDRLPQTKLTDTLESLANESEVGIDQWRDTAKKMNSFGNSEMLMHARMTELMQSWFDGKLA